MSKICKVCLGIGKTPHAYTDVCINCDGLGVMPDRYDHYEQREGMKATLRMPDRCKEYVNEKKNKLRKSEKYGRSEREKNEL